MAAAIVVIIAVDASQQAELAFDCEYIKFSNMPHQIYRTELDPFVISLRHNTPKQNLSCSLKHPRMITKSTFEKAYGVLSNFEILCRYVDRSLVV